ncbi:MAG: cyclase family protein [Solirubrobacterales bacterium]|nr:cyclase family protein [Solirubrobacterales bacterium]MBV9424193.1 cyclase family protein [Solirubrobacterales bacterium]
MSTGPNGWIDVSVPISDGMLHWPGNPPVSLRRVLAIEHGDGANVSELSLGVHTGTHVDAPMHFLPSGEDVRSLDLATVVGPARVVAIVDPVSVTREELEAVRPQPGERLLLRTVNSSRRWYEEPFREEFVYVSADAARYLVECGVALVGVDYLSVGGFRVDGEATHHALLEAGVLVVEGLDLVHVEPGRYELVCLPLPLAGSDGAPARALLRPLAAERAA